MTNDQIISEQDRQAARDAMVAGGNACPRTMSPFRGPSGLTMCHCDLGAIDGCEARVEAIAAAIALARQRVVLDVEHS